MVDFWNVWDGSTWRSILCEYMSRRSKLDTKFPKACQSPWGDPPRRACDLKRWDLRAPVTDFFYLFFEMKLRVGSRGQFFFGIFSTSAFGRDLGSKTKIHDFVALFGLQDDPLRRTTDLLWASESVYWLWGSVPERSYHSYYSLIPSCRPWSLDEISKSQKSTRWEIWMRPIGVVWVGYAHTKPKYHP